MLIRRTNRSLAQPSFPCEIDWSHPLTNSLAECVVFNGAGGAPVSLVNQEAMTQSSTPTWRIDGSGIARSYGGGVLDRLSSTPARAISGAVTVSVGIKSFEATADSWHELIAKRAITGNTIAEYALAFNNLGSIFRGTQFFWNAGSSYQVILSTSPSDVPAINTFSVVTGTRSASNTGAIYLNGISRNSGALSAAAAGTTPISFGGCNDGNEPFSGAVYFAQIWSRELSAAEVRWISLEPYAFVTTRPYRVYSIPAAAGGGGGLANPLGGPVELGGYVL